MTKKEISKIKEKIKRLIKNPEMKTRKRINNIYTYFKGYSVEQIDKELSMLSPKDLEILHLRFGTNLKNPTINHNALSGSQKFRLYKAIIPGLEAKLVALYGQRVEEPQSNSIDEIVEEPQPNLIDKKVEETANFYPSDEVVPMIPEFESMKSDLTKEDYEIILQIVKTPTFAQMIKVLSPKEAMIVSFKLVYADNPNLSTENIAKFVGVEPQQVVEITKKALQIYRDLFNEHIDKVIELTAGPVLIKQ